MWFIYKVSSNDGFHKVSGLLAIFAVLAPAFVVVLLAQIAGMMLSFWRQAENRAYEADPRAPAAMQQALDAALATHENDDVQEAAYERALAAYVQGTAKSAPGASAKLRGVGALRR